MFSWEHGVQFGQVLERLKQTEQRQDGLEKSVKELRNDVDQIKQWGGRVGLLAVLWASAAAVNLPAQDIGGRIASFIKVAFQLR